MKAELLKRAKINDLLATNQKVKLRHPKERTIYSGKCLSQNANALDCKEVHLLVQKRLVLPNLNNGTMIQCMAISLALQSPELSELSPLRLERHVA